MSHLTERGEEILSEIASIHRADYLENNPGSNENDAERDFLHTILNKIVIGERSGFLKYNQLSNWIETIR